MTTHPTNLLMINMRMNLRIHRTQIRGIIEYVESTVNTEPGKDIEKYSGEVKNYVGNTVDT